MGGRRIVWACLAGGATAGIGFRGTGAGVRIGAVVRLVEGCSTPSNWEKTDGSVKSRSSTPHNSGSPEVSSISHYMIWLGSLSCSGVFDSKLKRTLSREGANQSSQGSPTQSHAFASTINQYSILRALDSSGVSSQNCFEISKGATRFRQWGPVPSSNFELPTTARSASCSILITIRLGKPFYSSSRSARVVSRQLRKRFWGLTRCWCRGAQAAANGHCWQTIARGTTRQGTGDYSGTAQRTQGGRLLTLRLLLVMLVMFVRFPRNAATGPRKQRYDDDENV